MKRQIAALAFDFCIKYLNIAHNEKEKKERK